MQNYTQGIIKYNHSIFKEIIQDYNIRVVKKNYITFWQ